LGDDLARGSIPLELDDVQVSSPIDGQQIDALAEVGDDLPPDLE
jgi:hypothetical protein